MDDMISREWVLKNLMFDVDREVVMKAPEVDAVEVVRCRDCVHYRNGIHNSGDEYEPDCEFDEVLDVANGYDNKDQFTAALSVLADERGVELPEEWWSCIVEHYTPLQKRFAEICREVIVPELKRMIDSKD